MGGRLRSDTTFSDSDRSAASTTAGADSGFGPSVGRSRLASASARSFNSYRDPMQRVPRTRRRGRAAAGLRSAGAGQRLMIYHTEPGLDSARSLALHGSLTAKSAKPAPSSPLTRFACAPTASSRRTLRGRRPQRAAAVPRGRDPTHPTPDRPGHDELRAASMSRSRRPWSTKAAGHARVHRPQSTRSRGRRCRFVVYLCYDNSHDATPPQPTEWHT